MGTLTLLNINTINSTQVPSPSNMSCGHPNQAYARTAVVQYLPAWGHRPLRMTGQSGA